MLKNKVSRIWIFLERKHYNNKKIANFLSYNKNSLIFKILSFLRARSTFQVAIFSKTLINKIFRDDEFFFHLIIDLVKYDLKSMYFKIPKKLISFLFVLFINLKQ